MAIKSLMGVKEGKIYTIREHGRYNITVEGIMGYAYESTMFVPATELLIALA